MKEEVTTEQAINRGRNTITYPCLIIFLGLTLGSVYLGIGSKIIPYWLMAIGIVSGIVLSILFWSFMIVRWKLWAFDNVRNVHELRSKALAENLIYSEGSIFNKTEIWSAAQKEKWRSICEAKFYQNDIYEDDFSVPGETAIYYSKKMASLKVLIAIIIIFGTINMTKKGERVVSIVFLIFGICMLIFEFRKLLRKDAQIIINSSGIQTKDGLKKWEDISDEQVSSKRFNTDDDTYLRFMYEDNEVKIPFEQFNISERELEKLIHVYRLRFEKSRAKRN